MNEAYILYRETFTDIFLLIFFLFSFFLQVEDLKHQYELAVRELNAMGNFKFTLDGEN